ncbi:helix-turn-helix transcriptional regulator [Halioxenophilus sp. WMMB6]|uniref:helix-turn-helix transcriptional regulator n=1 Tax=Halioxenophilus sp. WMMB6 TaxID=3073815 RepID=UPI00295EB66C|nr:AraC family transcriptional regulator ligand-binding domain-containing protein [Halioxenophilus sp. WMMB6]
MQRDLDSHRVLRGSKLFLDEILHSNPPISVEQTFRILDNALQLLNSDEAPFQLGQRLLPGANGAASRALMLAPNLYAALELFVKHQPLLSPLLVPRFHLDDHYGYLYWQDGCGAGKLAQALVEASTVAVIAFSRRQLGARPPWQLAFRHTRPKYIEQYWAHMGDTLAFGQPCDLMRIPREYLFQNWQAEGITGQLALTQAGQQLAQLPASQPLLAAIYDQLMAALCACDSRALQLESLAAAMAISPATLKRHLQKHGSHFQRLLDQVRLHRALYLLHHQRLSTEAVAQQLGFHDSAGFRRSFKRWTGQTPAALLQQTESGFAHLAI